MNKKKQIALKVIGVIGLLALLFTFLVPLPYYIEQPGTTEPLAKMVKVDGVKDKNSGSFNLTTVGIRRATTLALIFSRFDKYEEILSQKDLMGTQTSAEYNQMQEYYMESAENAAIYMGLKLADEKPTVKYKGVYVMSIDKNSAFADKLNIGDTVSGVNNKEFSSSAELMKYIQSQKVNDIVTVNYIRDDKKQTATGKLMKLSTGKAGIGITLVDHSEVTGNKKVDIDAGSIGGPSAGLMFTLETYEQLTGKNLRNGRKIAGTGTMDTTGTVGRIGGIDKKIVTASRNNCEIFFAPDDEITSEMKKADPNIKTNYEEAVAAGRDIKTKMKIVPVKTVEDAIKYLETHK
jgi:PDZ domain-containing protein